MRFLAIDPGYEVSAWLWMENGKPTSWDIDLNSILLNRLERHGTVPLVIETVSMGGMIAGKEVFDTCIWIGRFEQAAKTSGATVSLIKRMDIKMHLCGSSRAKDANVRQALIDIYGPGKEAAIGSKAKPGPLHGIKSDMWSALAIATVFHLRSSPSTTNPTGTT